MSRRIIVLAVPDAELLDVIGPYEVFVNAQRALESRGDRSPGYTVQLAAVGGRRRPLRTEAGIEVLPHIALEQLASARGPAIDTLIVAGGAGARRAVDDRA